MERHCVDQGTTERDCQRGIFLSVFSTVSLEIHLIHFGQLPGVQATESIAVETAQLSFTFARGGLISGCCKVLAMHHGLFSSRFQMWTFWQRRPCLKNPSHRRRSCHSPHRRCLHRRWKRSQRQLDKSQLPWDCPKSHRH